MNRTNKDPNKDSSPILDNPTQHPNTAIQSSRPNQIPDPNPSRSPSIRIRNHAPRNQIHSPETLPKHDCQMRYQACSYRSETRDRSERRTLHSGNY